MAIDISSDLAENQQVAPEQLALVINKARELMKLELEIAHLGKLAKQKEEEYNKLSTETLPELMQSIGISTFPLDNGFKLVVESVVRGSIPAESTIEKADEEQQPVLAKRRAECFAWLRANKAGSIIKDELNINLGKGQGRFIKTLVSLIKKTSKASKVALDVKQKESVNWQTLNGFLREKIENGAKVPMDTFSVFNGREAKIVPPKKKKEKQLDQKATA